MGKQRRHTPEQIIAKLREADVELGHCLYSEPGSDLMGPGCRFESEQSSVEQDHFSRQRLIVGPEAVEVYA